MGAEQHELTTIVLYWLQLLVSYGQYNNVTWRNVILFWVEHIAESETWICNLQIHVPTLYTLSYFDPMLVVSLSNFWVHCMVWDTFSQTQ